MLSDTQRLDRLVTRLLELSRLEADNAPPVELNVGDVVAEAIGGAADRALVSWRAPRNGVVVRGRRGAIVAAVRNLIDNASAHATPGTEVDVHIETSSRDWIGVVVTNQGAAIPAPTLERMWDRFFTTRADRGGTGLGLPIVAAAAKAHGGSVACTSSAEAGTTFTLTLPRAGTFGP
jgi:two-component system sensor histidine kinase ChvG